MVAFARKQGEEMRGDRPKPDTPDITELVIQELMDTPTDHQLAESILRKLKEREFDRVEDSEAVGLYIRGLISLTPDEADYLDRLAGEGS